MGMANLRRDVKCHIIFFLQEFISDIEGRDSGCAAAWCLNPSDTSKKVRMVDFPHENAVEFDDWVKFANCGRERITRTSKLCLGHFPTWAMRKNPENGRLKLAFQAVPSVENASEANFDSVRVEEEDPDTDSEDDEFKQDM